jgi:hypothetical protein
MHVAHQLSANQFQAVVEGVDTDVTEVLADWAVGLLHD